MAHKANVNLCVLWEDELRLAAKLLNEMNLEKDESEYNKKAIKALQACNTALYGLQDDHKVAVMLGASDLHRAIRDGTAPK